MYMHRTARLNTISSTECYRVVAVFNEKSILSRLAVEFLQDRSWALRGGSLASSRPRGPSVLSAKTALSWASFDLQSGGIHSPMKGCN